MKINGNGIVIDPGFNFIENFKGSNHFFDEIDAVFISHAHNDHTADLESILTLLYKYNEEIKDSDDPLNKDTIRHEIAEEENRPFKAIEKEKIYEKFLVSTKRKIIDIYLTVSTFKKYAGLFELFTYKDYIIHIVETGNTINYKNIKISILKSKHHDIVSDYFSVGFVFFYKNSMVVYTGDSGWNDEIKNQYSNLSRTKNIKYKILIAHIGGFKESENDYLNDNYKGYDAFYKNHLGRLGLAKLNEILKPNICLISEFGEEIKGSRIKISKIYQDAFKNKIKFFPADIGFTIDLDTNKTYCINSIDFEIGSFTCDYIDQTEVETVELKKDYSLNYYNKNSDFTECELIQILMDKYEKSKR